MEEDSKRSGVGGENDDLGDTPVECFGSCGIVESI